MSFSTPPAPPPQAGPMPQVYAFPTYLFRRKTLQLLGGRIDIYGPSEQPLMVSLQKAFKLREDIRLYKDDTKTTELLTIKARQIIDFSAAYDVTDPTNGQFVGTVRRRGLKSMLRDTWEILDPNGKVICTVQEDRMWLAIIRRLIEYASLIPQSYSFLLPNGQEICEAKQRFNLFIFKLDLTMPAGPHKGAIDPRLLIAATTLLTLIEGRQR